MSKVRVHQVEVEYKDKEPAEKEGATNVGMDAALRPAEEPKTKKGWWRKFWDWVWS